jgi:hypothetical protein
VDQHVPEENRGNPNGEKLQGQLTHKKKSDEGLVEEDVKRGDAMATKIMVVRHGEKPDKHESIHGVTLKGEHDKNELSTRGWQRSGALVRFFNPISNKLAHPALAKPDFIFAENPSGHVKSERALNTVRALAESLRLKIDLKHNKGEEKKLVKDALSRRGVVLISWEHKEILEIANLILGSTKASPQRWPNSRFDLVWVFDQQAGGKVWKFTQVPQLLLPGDSPRTL